MAINYCRDSVRFAFGHLIQQQLNSFLFEWNMHRIRPSNMAEAPCGIPNILYNFPELKGMHMPTIPMVHLYLNIQPKQ